MNRLRTLDMEMAAVTPMFIGGAGFKAELRPPSFRGCLRYWYRALAGGLLGQDVRLVRSAEAAVFGSTSRASSVVLRLRGQPQIGAKMLDEQDQRAGLNYMLWSAFQRRRDAILPGECFQLRLQARPFPFAAVDIAERKLNITDCLELACASLWLLTRLGGVGARGRRGGGGMRAVAEPKGWPESLPPLVCTADSTAALAQELGDGISRIQQAAGWQKRALAEPYAFDMLEAGGCQLFIVDKLFASWWEGLDWIGELFLAFRREQKEDASVVAGLLTQGRLMAKTIGRAVFGLPIVFFFKSMLAEFTAQGLAPKEARRKATATVQPVRGMARTSPIFFRVLQLPTDPSAFALVIGVFRSRLLPDTEMTVRPNDFSIRAGRVSTPQDFSLIDEWLESVREQGVSLLPITLT